MRCGRPASIVPTRGDPFGLARAGDGSHPRSLSLGRRRGAGYRRVGDTPIRRTESGDRGPDRRSEGRREPTIVTGRKLRVLRLAAKARRLGRVVAADPREVRTFPDIEGRTGREHRARDRVSPAHRPLRLEERIRRDPVEPSAVGRGPRSLLPLPRAGEGSGERANLQIPNHATDMPHLSGGHGGSERAPGAPARPARGLGRRGETLRGRLDGQRSAIAADRP